MEIRMKLFIRAGLSFFLLQLFTTASTAREFLVAETIVEQAALATVEKYPDADDVLIDDFIQVEYQTDGTSEMWDDTAIKILTEKGKRDNRTLTLHFNTSYGTNYFTKVEIIKPDGTVIPVDTDANSKVMVSPGQMSQNIYNPNQKILNLSVPGLEVGDTLRYIAHDITTKTVVPDTWSDYQVFESTTPIERYTYQVIAPADLPLKRIVLKDEVPGTVSFEETQSDDGERIVYTWTVSDVPRMFEEPNMPKYYTVVQRLLVSTIDSWEDLSAWYWDLCIPRLEATTPEMEEKAEELVSGLTNTLDKITAVFNFVSQDIRYMGITPEEEAPGYEPHDVCITFENRYGVCRDKAALLAEMLRLVDIEAFPVIIMAGPKKDEEVPQPFFNHAITAALGDDGEYILMDSTDENTKDIFPSYLQNMSYLVARPGGETLLTSPIIPAEDNLLRIKTSASLDTAGTLEAESSLVFEGINDTVYRNYFSKLKPQELHRFFEGHLKKHMPAAVLETLEILPEELRDTSRPLAINMTYSAENLLIEGEANRMFKPPRLGGSLGYANFLLGQTGLDQRKYPLYTRMTAGVRETLELELPDNLGEIQVPDYQSIDTEPLTWRMQLAQRDGRLYSTNTFMLNTVEFSPEEYLELKANLKDIEYNLRKSLIADTEPAGISTEADVRILEQDINIVLESPDRWTETQRSKIQVLTYAGKKDYSEIKIPYNPAWQEIELTKATVTLPDGTVKETVDDEINLMDSPWVATAPRYPAERILVVSLPGVEMGSILEYEIVSRVDGKPFFSTTLSFNGHEPIDRKTATLTLPSSLDLAIRNTGVAQSKSAGDDTLTYTWSATNQPAVKKEEALPAWWTFNPTVFLSAGDWEEYGSIIHSRLKDAANNQAAAENLARELVADIADKREKAIAIRDWVAENIREAGPGLPYLPLDAIAAADRTLEDRYGNNADRMAVLHAMLQAAGLQPSFVLSGGIPLIPEAARPLIDIPSRNAFDTVLIQVDIEGETIYLNGSSQYAELGASAYNHRLLLNLATGDIESIRVAPGKDDRTSARYEMSIAPDGEIGLTETLSLQGTQFEMFQQTYAEMTPENRRRHYLELVSGISQSAKAVSELTTDYGSYPGSLMYSIHAPRYGVQDGDYLYFTLPADILGGLLKYRSNERTLPLAWNGYVDRVAEFIIMLPDGYEPVIIPGNYAWQAPRSAGVLDVSVEYDELANAIRLVQIADLDPALIPADAFPDIIEAGRRLAHPNMRTILLKKKK
jgi:transglutaminase-like putative cysteine protease